MSTHIFFVPPPTFYLLHLCSERLCQKKGICWNSSNWFVEWESQFDVNIRFYPCLIIIIIFLGIFFLSWQQSFHHHHHLLKFPVWKKMFLLPPPSWETFLGVMGGRGCARPSRILSPLPMHQRWWMHLLNFRWRNPLPETCTYVEGRDVRKCPWSFLGVALVVAFLKQDFLW